MVRSAGVQTLCVTRLFSAVKVGGYVGGVQHAHSPEPPRHDEATFELHRVKQYAPEPVSMHADSRPSRGGQSLDVPQRAEHMPPG